MSNLIFIDEPVYDKNKVITDFPWRKHNDKEIMTKFNKLKKHIQNDVITLPIRYRRVGVICTDIFFQQERLSTASQRKYSCVDMWYKHRTKILLYHNKRLKNKTNDLFGTIVFMFHAPSHFPTYTAAMVYKHFNSTKVFDPYAGWGNRCLAAITLDIDYLGIDSNYNLIEPYTKLIQKYSHNSNVRFKHGYSENVDINDEEFDLVFTSPPFWVNNNMLEIYNGTEKIYDIFMETSLIPVMKKCLSRSVWVCLYISENMYNDLEKIFGSCQEILSFSTPKNTRKKSNQQQNNIFCWK